MPSSVSIPLAMSFYPSQGKIKSKKQHVEEAFEKMQKELGEQQYLLLSKLRELEQQIWNERDGYISKVSEEVTRLGLQIKELEEKCQQPASELLHVRDNPPPHRLGEGFPYEGQTLERGGRF